MFKLRKFDTYVSLYLLIHGNRYKDRASVEALCEQSFRSRLRARLSVFRVIEVIIYPYADSGSYRERGKVFEDFCSVHKYSYFNNC